jgi:hypothetical protein
LKQSACCDFLKKIGMKCRRCRLIPGKAANNPAQQKAQQEFHDQTLQPLLEEAKQGKRTVLFVDATHFVMDAFFYHFHALRGNAAYNAPVLRNFGFHCFLSLFKRDAEHPKLYSHAEHGNDRD